MSSEVPRLSDEQIEKIALRDEFWFSSFHTSNTFCWSPFARAIEQAVRAQWAAEVAAKDAEIARQIERREAMHNAMHSERDRKDAFVEQVLAERDSAQAEAMALKADAERYRWIKKHISPLQWCGAGHEYLLYIYTSELIDDLDAQIDAALQPGAKP